MTVAPLSGVQLRRTFFFCFLSLFFLGVGEATRVFGADGFEVNVGKIESQNFTISQAGQLFGFNPLVAENSGDVFRQIEI